MSVKKEITTYSLMLILNFEIGVLAFDCYINPISEYDYFWGSVFTIGLIITITLTIIKKLSINRLIDIIEADNK